MKTTIFKADHLIGTTPNYDGRPLDVWVTVEYRHVDGGPELGITGVIGPKANGDRYGSCGQIYRSLPEVTAVAPWTQDMVERLAQTWDRWHLNRMRAGSPAQETWLRENSIDPRASYFDEARKALAAAGLNPDPDTGYIYGSAWMAEEVPDDVIDWLSDLPVTTRKSYPWGNPR